MDTTFLVSDLSRQFRDNGWDLLEWLKKKDIEVNSMYWFFDSEWAQWRLLIASSLVDKEGGFSLNEFIYDYVRNNFTDEDDILVDHLLITSPEMLGVREMKRRYKIVLPDRRVVRRLSQSEPYIYCLSELSPLSAMPIREFAA